MADLNLHCVKGPRLSISNQATGHRKRISMRHRIKRIEINKEKKRRDKQNMAGKLL
jgi:hypothetical protein